MFECTSEGFHRKKLGIMNQVAWTLWFHPQLPHCHLTIHLQEPLGQRWDEFKKEFNVSKPLWIKTDIVGNNNKHIVHYLQTSQAAFAASSFSSWSLLVLACLALSGPFWELLT